MSEAEFKYFISYARADTEFVLELAKELRAVRVNIWLDKLDILGGQRWDRAVEEALKSCQGMIAVLSPDEVSYALEQGKLIIPLQLRACDIPFRLRRVQYVDYTKESGFPDLLRALRTKPRFVMEPLAEGEEPVPETITFGIDEIESGFHHPIELTEVKTPVRREQIAEPPTTWRSAMPTQPVINVDRDGGVIAAEELSPRGNPFPGSISSAIVRVEKYGASALTGIIVGTLVGLIGWTIFDKAWWLGGFYTGAGVAIAVRICHTRPQLIAVVLVGAVVGWVLVAGFFGYYVFPYRVFSVVAIVDGALIGAPLGAVLFGLSRLMVLRRRDTNG
jgi:hypothetical protein